MRKSVLFVSLDIKSNMHVPVCFTSSLVTSYKMLSSTIAVVILLLASTGRMVAGEDFSYYSQGAWGGVCVRGNRNRQSPIQIWKHNVKESSQLTPLQLSGWDVGYNGEFENTGHNVQFNPKRPGRATTTTFSGTYELQQVHMHWGRYNGEGSEHTIDRTSTELELHFVHTKRGGSVTDKDYYTVVAVMAEVDYVTPCGVWKKLSKFGKVRRFRFDSLLPKELGYYFYKGSLTTPPCSENVYWYVLKTRIQVPQEFVEELRVKVYDHDNELLDFNYRNLQNLGQRVVKTPLCQA